MLTYFRRIGHSWTYAESAAAKALNSVGSWTAVVIDSISSREAFLKHVYCVRHTSEAVNATQFFVEAFVAEPIANR